MAAPSLAQTLNDPPRYHFAVGGIRGVSFRFGTGDCLDPLARRKDLKQHRGDVYVRGNPTSDKPYCNYDFPSRLHGLRDEAHFGRDRLLASYGHHLWQIRVYSQQLKPHCVLRWQAIKEKGIPSIR